MPPTGERLRAIPLFATLPGAELERLAGAATPRSLPAGGYLVREGELGSEVYVVCEGRAEVVRGGEAVATLAAGDVVGEVAVVGDWEADTRQLYRRTASVRALTGLAVIELPGREVRRLARVVPDFSERIWESVRSRMPR